MLFFNYDGVFDQHYFVVFIIIIVREVVQLCLVDCSDSLLNVKVLFLKNYFWYQYVKLNYSKIKKN
jgi:hypothetical protein